MTTTLRAIHSIGTLDRTGVVQAATARLEAEALAELDVTRPGDLDECVVDVDVLVVGCKELSATGVRRIARWHRTHPASVAIAHLNGSPLDRDLLESAGIAQAVRGPLTAAKLRHALTRADDLLSELAAPAAPVVPTQVTPREIVAAAPEAELTEVEEPTLGESDAVDPDATEASITGAGDEDADLDAEPITPAPATARVFDPDHLARLVTIASATGGCGKTFYATSAASLLARAGWRVLLVDLDLQFGEVAAALQIQHPYSIYDGLYRTNGQRLGAADFVAHLDDLVCHYPLGFDVLTAPRDPVLADYVGARDAAVVLDSVMPYYDVVIVDTPPSLTDVVIAALDRSDLVAVMATPDVPSLRNLTAFTDVLRRLGLSDDRMRLILNKVEADIGITASQVNEAFDGRFRSILPTDRAVSRAVNLGTTVPAIEPRSRIGKALGPAVARLGVDLELGTTIVKRDAVPAGPPNGFGRLWQRVRPGEVA